MISEVPSVSSVHAELDGRLSSTSGRTDETTKFEDMFEIHSIFLSLSFVHIVELRLGMDFDFRFRDPNHTKNTGEGGEGRPGHPEGLMKRWRKLKRVRKIPSLTCEWDRT
jgi:hypothetical protein